MSEYIIDWDDNLGIDTFTENSLREGIVRCRDCVHYLPDPNPIDPGWPMWCEDTGRDLVQPDGFCAWGERREP